MSLKSREEILQSLTSITYVESTEEGPLSVIPRCPAELFEHLELDSGVTAVSSGQSVSMPDSMKNDNKLVR